MVVFPYNTTDFAFTLNDVFINFSTQEVNTFFEITISIKYFDFYGAVEKTKVLEYKIPLVNKAQIYNVGRIIHRYLAEAPVFSNQFGFQFKTAKVSFEVREIEIADASVVETISLNDVSFIAGPTPKLTDNNAALLSTNTNFERITENGFFIVNMLVPEGEHTIKLLKNDNIVSSETINATTLENVYSKKITAKEYSGKKGDVFTVQLNVSEIKKSVVVFPNNVQSHQVVFTDQFKLFRSLEATGHHSFPKEYKQITQKYKRNLIEILEIVSTEKVNSLRLDTGWLLKSDTETIDSLLDNKHAYLVENNQVSLEMVPISKKMTGEDSDEALYGYNLEFQINKKNA